MSLLPIFPLGTVLVPGQVMPLQLFEPRYLALHADLMALPEEERAVGVVLIRQGHEVGAGREGTLTRVGCEGGLSEHREVLADGRPLVAWVLHGRRRLRVDEVIAPDASRPYLSADVTWLDDLSDEATIRAALGDHARAAQAGLTVAQRQLLLECDPAERAALADRLIREEEALQRRFSSRSVHESAGGFSLN